MKTHLAIATIIGLLAASPGLAAEQQIKVDVSDLTCPTCSYTVASSMRSVPSVEILDFTEGAEFGKGVFTVTYDDATATPEMIVEAVLANGYPAAIASDDGS